MSLDTRGAGDSSTHNAAICWRHALALAGAFFAAFTFLLVPSYLRSQQLAGVDRQRAGEYSEVPGSLGCRQTADVEGAKLKTTATSGGWSSGEGFTLSQILGLGCHPRSYCCSMQTLPTSFAK
mmetsp:Transcript_39755/g.85837  ORF Transcript_39755/g.85837 Transcript_39755/m.85837 type:complete len:123 (+) Transcript_39755:203-571(+)